MVLDVHICAGFDKARHRWRIADRRRNMQRCAADDVACVKIDAAPTLDAAETICEHHLQHGVRLAMRCNVQWRAAAQVLYLHARAGVQQHRDDVGTACLHGQVQGGVAVRALHVGLHCPAVQQSLEAADRVRG